MKKITLILAFVCAIAFGTTTTETVEARSTNAQVLKQRVIRAMAKCSPYQMDLVAEYTGITNAKLSSGTMTIHDWETLISGMKDVCG